MDKMISYILQDYWFVGIRTYIKQHLRMYIKFLIVKKPRGRQLRLLHLITTGQLPFEIIHVDHVEPFITTLEEN